MAVDEKASLETLKRYAEGGHYYSDCAQLALDRIAELEAQVKSLGNAHHDEIELRTKHTALLDGLRKTPRYSGGAFGEAPTGEFASPDGKFMYADDVLAALGDEDE